jgi:hypothetical protein
MRGRKRREVPAPLLRLGERFAVWRRNRAGGEQIPKSLWKAAAKLAGEHGLNRTASVLKLDYYSLKKHVERQSSGSNSKIPFVELPTVTMASASECLIEWEDGCGASMRVRLQGTEAPDLLALARNFWNAE